MNTIVIPTTAAAVAGLRQKRFAQLEQTVMHRIEQERPDLFRHVKLYYAGNLVEHGSMAFKAAEKARRKLLKHDRRLFCEVNQSRDLRRLDLGEIERHPFCSGGAAFARSLFDWIASGYAPRAA